MLRRATWRHLLVAGLLTIGPAALAQDDPFAAPDPFAGPDDAASPFEAPAPEADSPFAAPPADAAPSPFEQAPADPFAGNPFDQPATGQGQTADPFAPTFGETGTPGPAAPADPFASPGTANPFDAPGAPANPFAAPETTAEGGEAPTGQRGISQLFVTRYEARRTFDGRIITVRRTLSREEAEAFDESLKQYYVDLANGGELPNFQTGVNDANEWADWMVYANQLQLWSRYCRDIVLVGTNTEFDETVDIQWPGTPQPQEQVSPDERGGDGRPRNIYNENRSLDDQLADFSPVPDTRGGQAGGGGQVIDPSQMDQVAVRIYQRFLDTLRSYEQEQLLFMQDLDSSLTDRANRRQAYEDWRESRRQLVYEFLEDWSRRYDGQVVTIAGVRYELYKPGNAPTRGTRGANIVITDYGLTPYDLINEDGELRGPAQ